MSFFAVMTVLSSKPTYFDPELDAKCVITGARKARSNDLYRERGRGKERRERRKETDRKREMPRLGEGNW